MSGGQNTNPNAQGSGNAALVATEQARNRLLGELIIAVQALALTGPVTTVASLPATGSMNQRAFVTDANATTFASVVAAGGANKVPVYFDGTNWRIG